MTKARERIVIEATIDFYRVLLGKLCDMREHFDKEEYEKARKVHLAIMQEHRLQLAVVAETAEWNNARVVMIPVPTLGAYEVFPSSVVPRVAATPMNTQSTPIANVSYARHYVDEKGLQGPLVMDSETGAEVARFKKAEAAYDYVQMIELRASKRIMEEWTKVFEQEMQHDGDQARATKVADQAVAGLVFPDGSNG